MCYVKILNSLGRLRAETRDAFRKEVSGVDHYLTDKRWALIATRVPGKESDPGCHGRNNRLFIEAVFWIARTGSAWRSLPPHFGKWYTNYTRFNRWMRKQIWPDVLSALAADETCEYFYDDGAIRHAPLREPVTQEAAKSPREARGGSESDLPSSRRSKERQRPAFAQRKSRRWRERSLRRQRGKWQSEYSQPMSTPEH